METATNTKMPRRRVLSSDARALAAAKKELEAAKRCVAAAEAELKELTIKVGELEREARVARRDRKVWVDRLDTFRGQRVKAHLNLAEQKSWAAAARRRLLAAELAASIAAAQKKTASSE